MTVFDAFRKVALACEGYGIERLSVSQTEESCTVDLLLRWGPGKPDVVLSFTDVYYLEVGRPPGSGAIPLMELAATVLEPGDDPWPAGLSIDLVRSSSLPPLLWFRAGGIIQMNIVSAIATAYQEIG
ncbi:hypothetical protein F8568_020680 [Actinomadura sp. LD22]|uniref:Uncharacterized protein n=1 Tax=Actinomadura physcomitrii TaxID=2650748 RepID=A0A6I4MKJ9_9ACTN|nr:hypothetical protein [Actinomadura physcomitrii]MWA02746.1 hypothetical protein [Actinomadura physcomitrii]